MSITINLYYTGTNGNAGKFAEEMVASGIVEAVRAEEGNEKYEYFNSSAMVFSNKKDGKSLPFFCIFQCFSNLTTGFILYPLFLLHSIKASLKPSGSVVLQLDGPSGI